MTESKKPARLAGLLLLGSLGSIVLSLTAFPSFDARSQYFPEWFGNLVLERREFTIALALFALTGILAILAGFSLFVALRRAESPTAALALLLSAAGAGFILAALLGVPAIGLLDRAADLPQADWGPVISDVHPWVAGSQTTLILFGLGGFAIGLLAAIIAVLLTGVLSRKMVIGAAVAPFAILILAAIPFGGQIPLVWLSVGLPAAIWSIGLGLYLMVTGRVAPS